MFSSRFIPFGSKKMERDSGAPSRSRFALFREARWAANRKSNQERHRLTNVFNHLAFSLFSFPEPRMADSELLNGKDEEEWVCKACGQAIWVRARRRQCYLCARFFHNDCRKQSVVLVKPSLDKDQTGRVVKCCLQCRNSHAALAAFAVFRASFEEKRRVDLLYELYSKLRSKIGECMQTFGALVIRFVEQNYEAEKVEYADCKLVQGNLAKLFQQLTEMMKRLIEGKFKSKREELVAKNMKNFMAEWISESLAQLRSLETSWKKVTIKAPEKLAVAVAGNERKTAANNVRITSVSPVVVPLSGGRVDVFGDNFAASVSSIQVFVENIECKVESISPKQISVLIPTLSEGPKDVRLVQFGSEILLPKILMYHQQFFEEQRRATSDSRSNSNLNVAAIQTPSMQRSIEEETERETLQISSGGDEVAIVSLNPVMSPLNGTMIELTGRNIAEECSVAIDGVFCDFVEVVEGRMAETQRLIFLSPRLLESGFKTVEVRNADGKSGRLENVLFYCD